MHKKAKRKNQSGNTDYISQPLTQGQVRRQARRTARLQTQPVKRQIKAEQRASQQQSRNIGDYFNQYASELGTTGQAVADAYAKADAAMAGTGQSVADYAEKIRQQIAGEGRADAALRGANYDPSQDTTAAQATVSRLDSSALLRDVNAADAASAADLYANKGTIAQREKIKQKLLESDRRRSLNQDLRDLAEKKGELRKQAESDLTQQERNFQLGQQAADLNARGQRIDAREAKRDDRRMSQADRIRERLQAQSQAETHRHNLESEAHGDQSEQRLRRQARAQRRQDRYERRHPNGGDNPNAPDSADVNHALAILRQTKPHFFEGKSIEDIIDALLVKDSSLTRKEAAIAARRYYKQNLASQVGAGVGAGAGQ